MLTRLGGAHPAGRSTAAATVTGSMSEQGQIATWIAAAQRGDRTALAKLMAAYGPGLRKAAELGLDAATRTRISPDDVLQAVFLDVARRIDRFQDRGPDSFPRWLNAILNQKLVDARRAVRRKVRDVRREVPGKRLVAESYCDLFDRLYADSTTPSRVVRRGEALGALRACVADLPELHRKVIELCCLEGLPVTEVARLLGKSEAAVRGLHRRALQTLRRRMDLLGEFTHGA